MPEPYLIGRGDATRVPLPDQSVDLVMGSPPYCDARTYDDGTLPAGHVVSRGVAEWVDWMLAVTTEALRVSRGAVVWVAAGVTRDRNYWPACEGLAWEWFKRGGHAYRPCYWHRNGIPGSGGDQWFRADVEYCLAFKRPGKLPWTANTAMGHPPKYAPGGGMSNRKADGSRVNPWGGGGTSAGRRADGTKRTAKLGFRVEAAITAAKGYEAPAICNPGTLIKTEPDEWAMAAAIEAYESITGATKDEIMRDMREALGSENLPEWFCRVLNRIQGEAVLREALQGLGGTSPERPEDGRASAPGAEDCSEAHQSRSLFAVRGHGAGGGPPQGQGRHEQRPVESGSPVHCVPPRGTQGGGVFGGWMPETLLVSGLLQHALPAFQEARKSFDRVLSARESDLGGNLIRTLNGGGHLGSKLAFANEAPYPESLADHFIRSLCPPGGRVLDPFGGSATTAAAAAKAGRVGLSLDLRQSQCLLGRRRMAEATSPKPAPKRKAKTRANYVMQELDNFDAAE